MRSARGTMGGLSRGSGVRSNIWSPPPPIRSEVLTLSADFSPEFQTPRAPDFRPAALPGSV